MADPTITGRMLILLGDGASPETFAYPCGANARSVTFTNNTGEEVLLDCDDPLDTPSAVNRWVESQDTQMSISGRVATESLATWREWADASGAAAIKNIRVQWDHEAGAGGGYHTLPAILQSLEMGVEAQGTSTFTATIVGAGRRVWTDAA